MEDPATSPAAIDTASVNDEESMQSYHYPDPIGPYVVKASPGKGQGLFASRDIIKGERILVDKPFFVVPKPYDSGKILSHFERMPLALRQQYTALHCPPRYDAPHLTDVMRIFEANSFNIGDASALFGTATRFNHSCLPNTYYSWRTTQREIVFHSMDQIPRDAELTICYSWPPFSTRLERRAELRFYDFHCTCVACDPDTAFGRASKARRLEMRDLNKQITAQSLHDPLPALQQLIELITLEGLHGELMTPCRAAADCLRGQGRFAEAVRFARWELAEEQVCLGMDSEVVAETTAYVADLERRIQGPRTMEDPETLSVMSDF